MSGPLQGAARSSARAGRTRGRLLAPLVAFMATGCVSAPEPPALPPISPQQLALALERDSELQGPVRIVFDWSLREPELRVRGRGVARVEPPYKARLDLFAENGETIARAVLVDDDLRLPPGTPVEMIPPPALFWATLGVFRPGATAGLLSGTGVRGGAAQLEFRLAQDDELRYKLLNRTMDKTELIRDGHVIGEVRLGEGRIRGFPSGSTYRNLADFRELKIELESVETVESYPPDIWTPGR